MEERLGQYRNRMAYIRTVSSVVKVLLAIIIWWEVKG